MTADLVAFLRAQLDADEQWALACNRPYEYAEAGAVAPPGGVRWRWVAGDQWDTATPDPVLDEFVVPAGEECWLATVETWPSAGHPEEREMPRTYATIIVEMDAAAAGHIVRHDPASVLRDVAARRRIVDWAEGFVKYDYLPGGLLVGEARRILRWLAPAYAGRDGYRPEWAPT